MRTIKHFSMLLTALAVPFGLPSSVGAQSVGELMASMQRGGGWVSVPIKNGTGHVSTATLPTVGLTVAGCIHVWGGHTGRWDIRARDALGSGRLQMQAGAGESVPFTYTAGMRSQLEVDFSWSEPRDTTLYLWVGLARPNQDPQSTCEPVDG
jgi:hypothetical protein